MASGPHRKPNGKWEVRYREGSRNRGRAFDLKGDAQKFKARVERSSQLGEPVAARTGNDTLEEFFARWIANRQIAPRTRATYLALFKAHVLEQLGYAPLPNLTIERMEEWQAERLRKDAGPESIAKTSAILYSVLKSAVRQGKLASNPMEHVERPRVERIKRPPLAPKGIEGVRFHLLEQKRLGDVALVSLMAYGGLRVGEALGLHWEDFSQGNRLWISHSLEDDGTPKETKTGKERLVTLPEPSAQDLLTWRREIGTVQGLVFPRAKDGKGWTKEDRANWNKRYFKKACEAAGLEPVPPKNLRHSAASLRIAAGKRPTEVAEELGHTLAVSIDVYQRLMREFEGQPIRPMDEVIQEAREKVAVDGREIMCVDEKAPASVQTPGAGQEV